LRRFGSPLGSGVVTSPKRMPMLAPRRWTSEVGTCSVVSETPVGSFSESVMRELESMLWIV
jgi:hypothetical protein